MPTNESDKSAAHSVDPFFLTLQYTYDTPESETMGLPDGYRIGITPVIYEGRYPPAKPASINPIPKQDGTYEMFWATSEDYINDVSANFVLVIKIGAAPNHELLFQWVESMGWPGEADFSKQQQQDKQGG